MHSFCEWCDFKCYTPSAWFFWGYINIRGKAFCHWMRCFSFIPVLFDGCFLRRWEYGAVHFTDSCYILYSCFFLFRFHLLNDDLIFSYSYEYTVVKWRSNFHKKFSDVNRHALLYSIDIFLSESTPLLPLSFVKYEK